MRTTLNLSDEAHGMALSFARDQDITLSEAVSQLLLREAADRLPVVRKQKSGLPVFQCVRRVSSDDVRAMEDDL